MKKVELAVKKVIEGKAVLNKDALRNPEILDFFAASRRSTRISEEGTRDEGTEGQRKEETRFSACAFVPLSLCPCTFYSCSSS